MSDRIIKSRQKLNYTIMDNAVVQLPELSFRAKGLFWYLQSLPEDWVIHVRELHKHAKEGRDATISAFNELVDLGLIIRVEQLRKDGVFSHMEYIVYPSLTENLTPQPDLPLTDLPLTDLPLTENPSLQSKHIQSKQEQNKHIQKGIDKIYKSYPSKCVVKGSTTGKSHSHKGKIKSLLKTNTEEELINTIERYVADCKRNGTFMKNFSTFLNNLPDYSDVAEITKPIQSHIPTL